MGKLTFITGGCRSGKTTTAIALAKKQNGSVAYVATAVGIDAEMRARITRHKIERPACWKTVEEPYHLSARLSRVTQSCDVVLIDCLTVYLANLMVKKTSTENIRKEITKVLQIIHTARCHCIVVSNEVGLGIVPATALGRKFRDLAGEINKIVAAAANRVFFMVSGIPLRIK